ncbi:MAG: universal stress protein [Paracoccaceae bacterium]
MFRSSLISVDHSAAQGPLLDCLSDLRDMGVSRMILTHVVQVGYVQGASYGNKQALEAWLQDRAAPLRAAGAELAAIALGRLGAHVYLVHVLSSGSDKIYARWPTMAQATLSYIAQDVRAAGGTADVHLTTGKPPAEIARIAAEHDTDLIIVGKHGKGWSNSLTIGSTAANLCEVARRPVMVVPVVRH